MFQNKKISLFALFANFEAKQTQNWGALQVNVLHINQTFFNPTLAFIGWWRPDSL